VVADGRFTHHSILIGAETFGLAGCENDVMLMADVLAAFGFRDPCILTGARATRNAILNGFESLIERVRPGDAVVVYYSGHGGRVARRDWSAQQARGRSPYLQFLVPTDADESSGSDFRGLLAEEITAIQGRLTDVTPNVTTILDCCHSAYMARGAEPAQSANGASNPGTLVKAIDREFPVSGALLRLNEVPPERQGAETNPMAVRVVACQPEQSAYERQSYRGGRHGVLTDTLSDVLEQLGDRAVPWQTVLDVLRRRVQAAFPEQRPEVEGPAGRLPFSIITRGSSLRYPVTVGDAGAWIEGAALFGLEPGDELRLAAPEATGPLLGRARVDRIDPAGRAVLRLTLTDGVAPLPVPCDGLPAKVRSAPLTVRLEPGSDCGAALRAAIAQSPMLAVADHGVAVVRSPRPGTLTVEAASGRPALSDVLPDDAEGVAAVVSRLERWAQADRMRSLASGEGATALAADVVVQLRTHEGAEPRPCRDSGERLATGDAVSVVAANQGHSARWVWLIDVGVDDEVTVLTPASGTRLEAHGTPGCSAVLLGRTGPRCLEWGSVPADRTWTWREQLVVIVADRQQDLSPLGTSPRGVDGSALDALMDEIRVGTRNLRAEEVTAFRYRVQRIDFELEPAS
jgi:hypothetical protein